MSPLLHCFFWLRILSLIFVFPFVFLSKVQKVYFKKPKQKAKKSDSVARFFILILDDWVRLGQAEFHIIVCIYLFSALKTFTIIAVDQSIAKLPQLKPDLFNYCV